MLTLAFNEVCNAMSEQGLPILYHDQVTAIKRILAQSCPTANSSPTVHKLTHKKLQQQDNWPEQLQVEAKQLDQYIAQGMFGGPQADLSGASVFHWV